MAWVSNPKHPVPADGPSAWDVGAKPPTKTGSIRVRSPLAQMKYFHEKCFLLWFWWRLQTYFLMILNIFMNFYPFWKKSLQSFSTLEAHNFFGKSLNQFFFTNDFFPDRFIHYEDKKKIFNIFQRPKIFNFRNFFWKSWKSIFFSYNFSTFSDFFLVGV